MFLNKLFLKNYEILEELSGSATFRYLQRAKSVNCMFVFLYMYDCVCECMRID